MVGRRGIHRPRRTPGPRRTAEEEGEGEGEGECEVAGKTHHPQPGEERFIPRGAKHSVRNTGNSRSTWLFGYNS